MTEKRTCAHCRHFIDHSGPEDEPDEPNGYCGELVDRLGITKAVKVNEYGGFWTSSTSTCDHWEGGEKIWK